MAFLSALIIGSALHYEKIVQNEWFGYPDEWFPSVSATIGDRYPERSIFMIFIAITSGTFGAAPLSALPSPLLTRIPPRPEIRSGRTVVPPHCEARPHPAESDRHLGRHSDSDVRRVDLHHLDR